MKNKFPLGFFPTPVHALKNLSREFKGHQLFIKRDDQSGLASGGNKTRKLEYIIREALDMGCDTVITAGAQQSNHCRQTAAACNVAGLECHLLVRGSDPGEYTGNLLLSILLGAHVHYTGEDIRTEDVETLIARLKEAGRLPYYTPIGGSTLTGAMGFVEAAGELKGQLDGMGLQIDQVYFASCSGGTQAGLALGKALHGLKTELVPVSIEKPEMGEAGLEASILEIVRQGREALGLRETFSLGDLQLLGGYDDAGYGVLTQNEKDAIHLLARMEGILLDPVYSARAFFAMTDQLSRGLVKQGSNILFWHTGGLPANFHYGNALL
jgi:D-cysteine desulfhydrase family pyridoxal phosphate-dependent enzyme